MKVTRENIDAIYEEFVNKQPKFGEWIPIRFRETTDEDGVDKEEFPMMFDCPLPDNGDKILISTKAGYVTEDVFFNEGECYLEDHDWDEVVAWMPLPEAYKE